MKWLPLVLSTLLFSGCYITEVEPCDSQCQYTVQLKRLEIEKNELHQELASWRKRFLTCSTSRTPLNKKAPSPKADMAVYNCRPMPLDSADWNIAVKWGMSGDKVEPYICSSIQGHPINKYPHWYRKLWHEKGNECILRVQEILEEPNGNMGYGAHGVSVFIKWRSPSSKSGWTPKAIKKPSTI